MAVKRYNGTSWDTVAGLGAQGAAATSSSITTWVKTAAGGETSLTGSSDSSTTLAYTPGQEQFFINGVLQVRGSDYTATNGTSITGLTALIAGDIATVTTVNAFSVTGAVPLSTVTANGDLIVGTSAGAVGRLGVGSTGQVLSVSGGAPAWATPAAPGNFSLLGSATLSGNTTTVSGISGMNQIYVLINACSTTGGGDLLRFRINTDTGANYDEYTAQVVGNTSWAPANVNGNANLSNSYMLLSLTANVGGSAYYGGLMLNGCNTSGNKMAQWAGANTAAGGNGQYNISGLGRWTGTATVSSVSLNSSGGTFDAGTMYVYGSA